MTIISSNCIGALLLRDLGLRFDHQLLICFFRKDFFIFLKNINYYLYLRLSNFALSESNYPMVKLDDITINFVHHKSFDSV